MGNFGRRNWKHRWFQIADRFLEYYEDYDDKRRRPVNKKGAFPLHGSSVALTVHHDKQYSFLIKNEEYNELLQLHAGEFRLFSISYLSQH